MKTGVNGLHLFEKHFGQEKYIKIKELGYDCADFSMTVTEENFYTLPLKEAEHLILNEKRLADEAGVAINQVHGPWKYPPNDATEEDRCKRLEKMKKSIYLTSLLGCKYWVIHPIMPFGLNDIEEGNAEKTREINRQFFGELLKCAKENNVTICYENMPFKGFSISAPGDVLKLVKEIDDENFKICLDTGHVNVLGLSAGDAVRKLGDYIKVFHIHDNKQGKDLHLMPYLGEVDWADFMKALKDIDFKGVFSLETSFSPKLSADIFEELNKVQFKITKEIINLN